MKGGKEHKVPLSERAIELLRGLPTEDGNGFVFLGPRGGSGLSNMAMTQVLKRMDRGDITVHGFRSSFRDWASETTNFPNHVVEMALAHVDRRQGGSGLSARRSIGQTPTARRGVVEILHVTATGWRGAADAEASMKPEEAESEAGRRQSCARAALKVLRELLDAAKAQTDPISWRGEGGPEFEDFVHALESGGSIPC